MDEITRLQQTILSLLRAGTGKGIPYELPDDMDWEQISTIAMKHHILPFIMQGTVGLPVSMHPPEAIMKQWKRYVIGNVMHNERSIHEQQNLIHMLNAEGIPCAILKGTSLSILYPKPELRPLGDIDVLVNEKQYIAAGTVIQKSVYGICEGDHPFHMSFNKEGIHVEIHKAVTEYPRSPVGEEIAKCFSCALSRSKTIVLDGYSFPVLSDEDQAICLLLHMERHLLGGGIGLRQLCDWSVFIDSIDIDYLEKNILQIVRACKLYQFASVLTRICVRYLGLDEKKHMWCMNVAQKTAEKLLLDILENGNISNGERERATSSTFVKGEENESGTYGLTRSAMVNLSATARKRYPITKKVPLLLPLFWVYIPAKYIIRSAMGNRPKQSITKVMRYAKRRKRLYRELQLFKK